jgi:puromycin-sensitive aminopeptidase
VERPVREIVLHAIALELQQVELRFGGRVLRPRLTVRPVSESVVLSFDEPLPAGQAELQLRWTGRFTDGLRGLYLAEAVAATQFEAADARRVFPCFDEPAIGPSRSPC